MSRYVAFLRAINVGGHVVKMERLRVAFEELGLAHVETFITSGNVIFESRGKPEALEKKIARHLAATLGYGVATFLRTDAELARIAAAKPFGQRSAGEEGGLFVGFLHAAPNEETKVKLKTAGDATNEFRLQGRELYWLCRTRFSDSKFSGARLEKLLGVPATFRNMNTVDRLVAKYSSSGAR